MSTYVRPVVHIRRHNAYFPGGKHLKYGRLAHGNGNGREQADVRNELEGVRMQPRLMRVSCQRGWFVWRRKRSHSLTKSLSPSACYAPGGCCRCCWKGAGGCGTRVSRVPITHRHLLTCVHRYARVMSLSIKPPRLDVLIYT